VQLQGSISTTTIADGAITTVKLSSSPPALSNDTLGHSKMDDNYLSANAEGRGKMQTDYIQTAKIQDAQVTPAKLSAAAQGVEVTRNLVITNNAATPFTKVDLTADEALLKNASGVGFLATAVAATINAGVIGAVNGLDTGTQVLNTWYYIYIISDGTTVGGILSTNASAPNLAWGAYTYYARVGVVRSDASVHFAGFYQVNRQVWTTPFVIFSGIAPAVSLTYQTLTSTSAGAALTAFRQNVPATAWAVRGYLRVAAATGTDAQAYVATDGSGVVVGSGAGAVGETRIGSSASTGGVVSASGGFELGLKTYDMYWTALAPGTVTLTTTGFTL
jgi:hypothetical protein